MYKSIFKDRYLLALLQLIKDPGYGLARQARHVCNILMSKLDGQRYSFVRFFAVFVGQHEEQSFDPLSGVVEI